MQRPVAPHLEPPPGALEVEVRDADEDRARHRRRRRPDGQRDDRLVLAVAADRQDRDPRRHRGRRSASRARRRSRRGSGRRPSAPRACRPAPGRRRGRRALLVVSMPSSAWRTRPEVGRLVDHDPGAPVGGDDADHPAGRQVAQGARARPPWPPRGGSARRPWRPCWPTCRCTSTMSRARPAGRSRNGRAASRARITTSSSWSRSSRLRRSFCHGALASTSATRRVHSRVDGTTVSSRRSLSRYIAMTAGMNSSPSSASGVVNGIAPASPARAGAAARRTSGRRGSCPTTGRRSSPAAWPRDRRSPPSRPPGGPCRRRWWRGRR